MTLVLDQTWLRAWADSGVSFPIRQRNSIDLPAGRMLVYYESQVSVPVSDALLYLFDPMGNRILPTRPDGDHSYRLWHNNWNGRALWEVEIPRADRYEFICYNNSVLSDDLVPADDRVVFLKQPSVTEVKTVRAFIQVTGASVTLILILGFYLLHIAAVQRQPDADDSGQHTAGTLS